jgi:hypothetical protein
MLKVTFSILLTCNCWKMSPWNQEELSLSPSKSSRIDHACADYSWDGSLLPPFSWRISLCTPSHWLIYSRTRKSPRPSLSSFTFFHQGLSSISLQEAPGVAIVFWQSQSYLSFWSLTCSPYLENKQCYPDGIHCNFLFRNTKFEVWFHLTRAESQAVMMVGVPQGFDIGLFEIRQGWCRGWHN